MRRPAASRNSRPSGVSGTSPIPTSLATSTTGPAASRNAAASAATSSSTFASGQHQIRQPQGQAVDQQRALRRAPRRRSTAASLSGSSTVRQNGPRRARWAAMRAAISASPASPSRNRCRSRRPPRRAARRSGSCPSGRRPAPGSSPAARRAQFLCPPSAMVSPPPPEELSQIARRGGLLARGRRPRRLPSSRPSRWLGEGRGASGLCRGLAAYSCGGSAGIAPDFPVASRGRR